MDEKPKYSIREYVLFKLDRSIAVIGLVAVGITALALRPEGYEAIVAAVVTPLAAYVGMRAK
jgi:hypothetical protein